MSALHRRAAVLCISLTLFCAYAGAQTQARPWMNTALDADQRAHLLVGAMTQQEKLTLVFGFYSSDAPWKKFTRPAEGLPQSAGYVPGVPRLGIPALRETDAGVGVASQPGDHPTPATSLPGNLAIAATWNPDVAFAGGRMIGNEARALGFNVLLAGGINLARDPRGGRGFEYGGEDPLLAATMVGAQIRGIQSNHILATIKHFALNDQESHRNTLDVRIGDQAARMSDLLAFELAIEQSRPAAVMCSYNRVNGAYACENPWLLNEVLKGDWRYPGFVMSDWGGTHSTVPAANAGLDQQSGYPFDASPYFADALKEAVENGHVPQARLDDMAGRIVRSMIATGLLDDPVQAHDIDFAAHGEITRAAAEESIVLLKNARQLLPLQRNVRSIAIIGSHADVGVLSGGGSTQVYQPGGVAVLDTKIKHGPQVYHRSSPLEALARRLPAHIAFNSGADIASAVKLAAGSERVIVFAHQWSAEGMDVMLRLDDNQDALISAVARVNRNVIVVLETGGPVFMPWLDRVAAVVEAWYPGSSGGDAIARVLTGELDATGRLPVTFPRSLQQLPRAVLDGYPDTNTEKDGERISVDYNVEGAAVGYKWFDRHDAKPLFAFGHGLSYTRFATSNLGAQMHGDVIEVHFTLRNTGARAGAWVAQIYAAPVQSAIATTWEAPRRLAGFSKLGLTAGASSEVVIRIDPRLLAVYHTGRKCWTIAAGDYRLELRSDAVTSLAGITVHLDQRDVARDP